MASHLLRIYFFSIHYIMAKIAPPKGMRDFLPTDARLRAYLIQQITRVYEQHGFEPIVTPAVENLETLTGKYGDEGDKLLFKIQKRGAKAAEGCDLGLRYDLTVPLARFYAQHRNDLPRIFKRYQIAPVWRADRPGAGRFREFVQCDVDIIGAKAPYPEISLITAASDVFKALDFPPSVLRLNDRRVLRAMIAAAGIPAEQEIATITILDKLDKIGVDGVKKELATIGISDASQLLAMLDVRNSNEETIAGLRKMLDSDKQASLALDELATIAAAFEGQEGLKVVVDASLARGLDYYTGAIFEIVNPALGSSIAGGGRYDDLIGIFSKQSQPACGISLGFERMVGILQQRQKTSVELRSADVLVTIFNDQLYTQSREAALALRQAGIRVDLYAQADKLNKQFKYANQQNIPWVITIGDDEAASAIVSLKNMVTGEQHNVDLTEAIALIKV